MKNALLYTLLLIPFLIISQKKEKQFNSKIIGTISNYNGKTLYLHHSWNDQVFSDSVKIVEGKFTFNLKNSEPDLYWFNLSPYPNVAPNLQFFVDPGSLKANLNADSLIYSSVEGGPTQNDYLEYKKLINSFVATQMKMQSDYTEAMQKNDMVAVEKIRGNFQNLNTLFITGMTDFVKSHPKSIVSGYVVFSDMNNPAVPFENVVTALDAIDKSIQDTKFVKAATKRVDGMKGSMIGFKATDFSQAAPNGKMIKLSDFKGKYVLVDFWASWCGPCRMENPNVVNAYNKYKDKNFTVLGVSFDSNKEKWLDAVNKDNLTWDQVSDLKGWGNEAGKLFGISSIPQNLLLDKDGKIIAKNLRGIALEEKLAEVLK
ncbi:MAG: AhpC/TSA family protein [Sphingobacteriaceae bacterium]|nr:AhpC/TSA family protein [Sphingobacteriaceae bacterium]